MRKDELMTATKAEKNTIIFALCKTNSNFLLEKNNRVAFAIGDRVAVVDEVLCGIVEHVKGQTITIATAEGFLLHYRAKHLVKVEDEITVSAFEAAQAKKQKEPSRKKSTTRGNPKLRNTPPLEVDLHSHQLKKATQHLRAFGILTLQLETAQRQLEFAMAKRLQKVVFIHGVGKGVLKAELYALFRRYHNIKFYDADYQKYGWGATEVYIFQHS